LAKFFAIRFYIGNPVKLVVNPVMRELRKIVGKSLFFNKKIFYVDKNRVFNFLTYRSSLFKYFVFKNFSLYRILYVKIFRKNFSFFNFYLIWFLSFFFYFSKHYSVFFFFFFFFFLINIFFILMLFLMNCFQT